MKAKFIGDPRDPNRVIPEVFPHAGISFQRGRFVDVPDALGKKLEGNSHFEVQSAKGDQNTRRTAEDIVVEEGGTLPSTTGDPETMSRETMVSQPAGEHSANEPMREPGSGGGTGPAAAPEAEADATAPAKATTPRVAVRKAPAKAT